MRDAPAVLTSIRMSQNPPALLLLPPELLWYIIKGASQDTMMLRYCAMISLNRGLRNLLQSTARHFCFGRTSVGAVEGDTEEQVPLPTSAALAALIGPCHHLEVLEFSTAGVMIECGREAPVFAPWVETAFGQQHQSLQTLRIPSDRGLPRAALCLILAHLPHLEVLDLGLNPHQPVAYGGDEVLQMVAQCCPRLRSLGLFLPPDQRPDYGRLRSCPGLQRLELGHDKAATFGGLLSSLSHLETLRVPQPNSATSIDFRPLAAHGLTRLHLPNHVNAASLVSIMTSCTTGRLVGLDLSIPSGLPAGALLGLLGASGSTLSQVRLSGLPDELAVPTVEALGQLSHLDELELVNGRWAAIPERLLALAADRLTRLLLHARARDDLPFGPLVLRSTTLRWASLQIMVREEFRAECGQLESLVLPTVKTTTPGSPTGRAPAPRVVLDCPALRRLEGLAPGESTLVLRRPLDRLSSLAMAAPGGLPVALLGRGLTRLEGARVTQVDTLQGLLGGLLAPSLITARLLAEGLTFPPEGPLALRVQGALRTLDLTLIRPTRLCRWLALDGGSGLARLSLQCPQVAQLELTCPALAALSLTNAGQLYRLQWVGPAAALRSITLLGCPQLLGESLQELLRAAGTSLRSLMADPWPPGPTKGCWAALGELARLESICISLRECPQATLGGPRLREAFLQDDGTLRVLNLAAAPALERLHLFGGGAQLKDVRLAPAAGAGGQCPNLLEVVGLPAPLLGPLRARFAGLSTGLC
ncbi:hypothetical protein PAPYR_2011 [Paratrimastix pyriformis]|uniref:Uncharacterized protein n=1 Tax=Paratrimastix pyriformis TaxID=342808 RepID=A0ABQ8UQK2_9EUKA|nr:hypothetical protein PAPYR_2011 [Paratrimastix pyriformis]